MPSRWVGWRSICRESWWPNAGSSGDILLKDEDRLVVPRRSQEVTVLGEVQTVTSHLYQPGLARDDYVNLSGGTTQKADTEPDLRGPGQRAGGGVVGQPVVP